MVLALDQIVSTAAKLYYVSGGQYNVPIVIRGRGDPVHQFPVQHSQSMEKYFFNVPGLKVVCPSTPTDAKGLLKSAIRTVVAYIGMVQCAMEAAEALEKDSISVEIVAAVRRVCCANGG